MALVNSVPIGVVASVARPVAPSRGPAPVRLAGPLPNGVAGQSYGLNNVAILGGVKPFSGIAPVISGSLGGSLNPFVATPSTNPLLRMNGICGAAGVYNAVIQITDATHVPTLIPVTLTVV